MKLWVDNTGLHSVGYALEGKGQWDVEARGLLQFATLLVFADKLLVNGFESPFIAKYSRKIINKLRAQGLEKGGIEFFGISEPGYWHACERAAASVAEDVRDAFEPDEESLLGLEPPDLPPHAEAARTDFAYLLDVQLSPSDVEQLCAEAKSQRATGAVTYMVASNESLRAEIRRKKAHWSHHDLQQLSAYVRSRLNCTLAENAGAQYTPAVARASLLRRRNDYILQRLMAQLDGIAGRLRERPLPLPAVETALLARSKGDPAGVIGEAIKLRAETKDLRKWLQNRGPIYDVDDIEERARVDQAIREYLAPLKKALKLEDAPGILGALDISPDVGMPSPGLSVGGLLYWLQYRWTSKKLNVLTSLTRAAVYTEKGNEYFKRLNRRCCGEG